ncbi:MAG: MATE family efflux transporter [Candidatus Melainabacteria bacterium]|nr:MATE family efflux transporter [Candidatus Melainabacteria bacterium]
MSSTDNILPSQDEIIIAGSTWAAIWHMSWPLLLNMATVAVASFADIWVAGKLGSQVQAAIGVGGQIWYFMIILTIALSAGTTALVSRFWGARDLTATVEASRQSLLFAIIFGIVSASLGLIVCRPLLKLLGTSPEVEQLGWDYLRFDLSAQIPYTILWVSNSIFRAKGNARTPMIIMALITVLVIMLDLGLCLWPFHIGISGIGLSWLIAGIVGTILSLLALRASDIGACVDFTAFLSTGISKDWLERLMNIGIPACVEDLAWVGGNFVLFLVFAQTFDPTSCQAAWAVGLRLEEMVCGMPIYAFSTAVATIVGQNLGAGKPKRAEQAGWQVAGIGAAINLIIGLTLCLCAMPIASAMSGDASVIKYSAQYLQVIGLSEPLVAVWLILFGAMKGAGYTRWPMIASSVCLLGLRLPLAWYLTIPLKMGPLGTWISVAFSSALIGCIAIWRFKTGAWKYQKV